MRNIDFAILAELRKEELRPYILFHALIDGTDYRYTTCDIPITLNGNVYDPKGLDLSDVQYSSLRVLDQVTVTIDNLDSVMTSVFVGGTPQESEVTVSMVVLELNAGKWQPISGASVVLFQGEIDSWDLDEEVVNIIIATPFSRWNQRTVRRHASSCRWKVFKGTECVYTGTAFDCDRTFARCAQLGNTDNFGGFRWLPSIMDKEIWWGKIRETEK